MQQTQPTRRKSRAARQQDLLMRGLLAAFIVAALITGTLAFVAVRDLIADGGPSSGAGGISLTPGAEQEGSPAPEDQPSIGGPSAPAPELESWDGASRVNILVMGLDYRDWQAEDGPPRTDTMIVLTVDPVTRTAGMLSIPRDMWVEIPGFGHGKINTAYQLGEGSRLPGGGAGLAVQTIEQFLGIQIHYYARIDFNAFVRFIDEIGGVEIDIPQKIQIDIIGRPNPIRLKPGVQVLPGEYALAYARARNTEGGDFDRAQRQQQVILAMRDQLLRSDVQAHVIKNGFAIYQDLRSGIETNMSFEEAFKLGLLARQIDLGNIKRGVIAPPEQVTLAKSPDGLDILKPITEKIRILRDEIFTSSPAVGPAAVSADPAELMKAEEAKVAVYNGTSTGGLAGTTQEYLQSQGVNVVEVGNADLVNATKIIDYTGNPYTLKYLVELMSIQKTRIFNSYDPTSQVDVAVIIGPDWTVP